MINHLRGALKLSALTLLVLLIISSATVTSLRAQDNQDPNRFSYIVERGDTLILIALHYNLRLTDIIFANNLSNLSLVFPGQKLILPGVSPPTPFLTQMPPLKVDPHTVEAGESLFTIANQHGVTIGALILVNDLSNPDVIQVGQRLKIPESPPEPEPLVAPFADITLSEPVIIQGRSLAIKVSLSEPATLTGAFEGRSLFFHENGSNEWWSIIPIHALADPNVYPVTLTTTLADGTEVTTFTNVKVVEGPYGVENIELDDNRSELLDEELIRREREKLIGLWSQISPRPRWAGPFQYPVATASLKITSQFGTRRSYNGSPATSFHDGADFGGDAGASIYAPAAGRVVLAEKLTVRGNAVLIDHGMGLFSGYWHQSQLAVAEDQDVEAGDLIGYLGDTGLVTGPHLHWEMRLYGIAVDPMQWIQQAIP